MAIETPTAVEFALDPRAVRLRRRSERSKRHLSVTRTSKRKVWYDEPELSFCTMSNPASLFLLTVPEESFAR